MKNQLGSWAVLEEGTYCDGAALGNVLGISAGRISQLDAQGVFVREETPQGMLYELRESVQAYLERKTESPEDLKTKRDRAKAEAAIKKSKAVLAALEASELQKKMFRAEDIQAITEDMLFEIRSAIMNLPGLLAVEVSNASGAAECAAIIQTHINRMLMDLQKYRFEPERYEERIRERQNWTLRDNEDGDDEQE